MYDVIVVGAGSAGAVIAARLTEDAACSVLLVEAGPDYPEAAALPDDLHNSLHNSMRAHDWRFRAHHTAAGRPSAKPRGRVVGGSSAVNTAIALRGVPEDYDGWAALGNDQWAWAMVLPHFVSMEHDHDFGGPFHGDAGPIPVRRYRPEEWTPFQAAYMRLCEAVGFPFAPDSNDPTSTGFGPHPQNREGRQRVSVAVAYIAPARGRPNLTIAPNLLAVRVLLRGETAVGVEVEREDGGRESLFGRRIVLSAGAYQTPGVLIRSGIGPRAELAALGLDCVVDLPVGMNLFDHPTAGVILRARPGIASDEHPVVQTSLRYTAAGSDQRNDMQLQPGSYVSLAEGMHVSIGSVVEQANSVGRMRYSSTNPRLQPKIETNFLSDPEDLRRMVAAVRLAVEWAQRPELESAVEGGIYRPKARHLESDEGLGAFLRLVAGSGYHPCGTARMGPEGDPGAVVDQYGRLRGIEGLFVADASIMPSVPRANTNLTSIMIGERAGGWLRDGTLSAPAEHRMLRQAAEAPAQQAPLPQANAAPIRSPRAARARAAVERYTRARDLGSDFLESRQDADGMIGDVATAGLGGFYKAVWALAASGRTAAASRLAGWIRRNAFVTEGEGDALAGDFRGDFSRAAFDALYPYPNAWLIGGLQRLGAYDLATPSLRLVRGLLDPESGGVATRRSGPAPTVREEVMSSAMVGLAALACGDLSLANSINTFLVRIITSQPEPERVLYHVYTPERGVITEFPPEKAAAYAIYADRPRQAYFQYGIGAAFMVRYWQVTGEAGEMGALNDAARFLLPAHHAIDAMYETAQVGKVAWGAALLAGATGDAKQRALAERAADALLAQQNPDGSWDNTGGYTTEGTRDEVTAEFVAILDEVVGALATG